MAASSKIFKRCRALGYVSNHVPLVARYIRCRKENLVVTCVGKAFHTYGCAHFTLLSVSGLHSDEISCLAADAYHIFTACNNEIYAWRRGTELKHTYKGHTQPVHLLLPFGPHLLSVDESNVLKIWDIKSEEQYLELYFDKDTFEITALVHPSTYLNKILLGSRQGPLQLWNVHSSRLVYTFKGWDAPVSVLEQAPAIDVMAVGLANGRIILHNLKYDKTVMEFMQDWGFVTNISFRTDGDPVMISGTLMGHIVFWNLQDKKVMTQLLSAHNGAVTGLCCLPNEPLMVTSSPDNSLKMWIFDMPDGGTRLLRIREGHSAPPSFIRFHGNDSSNIISAGGDSTLRIFNTKTETFNKSLGQASYNRKLSKKKGRSPEDPLKMPPIIEFASEITREKDWDNIAAIHLGLPIVTTWSYDKLKMGNLKLLADRFDKKKSKTSIEATATCICLTHCGNFVIIGYSSGHVDRFNIQSGIHRGSYGNTKAHAGAVRGVATDNLNQMTVTGGMDSLIKFWPFKSRGGSASSTLNLNESVAFFRFHTESSMLAVALEDFSIAIVDLDTRNVIRKFESHTGQITDATFSPDSRWLITAAMDCTITTWDIPSAQKIDCFQMDAACTSLNFSPTGELLATTHVDYLGLCLWANKTLYAHVSLRPISETASVPLVALPTTRGEDDDDEGSEHLELDDDLDYKSPEQLSSELVTLSSLAASRWQNLLNIDIVRKRNKPKEPPKTPKAAPFFLPTVAALNPQFDFSGEVVREDEQSKIIAPTNFQNLSAFAKLLREAGKTNNFRPVVEKLKTMGPSAIDFEISSLSLETVGSSELLEAFAKLIEAMLQTNKDFELGQAYLGLFLKIHGDILSSDPHLSDYLVKLQQHQSRGWQKMEEKLFYTLSVINALKIA